MKSQRWTVRNIDYDTIQRLKEVSQYWDVTMGYLVNEAVSSWYNQLPEEEGSEDAIADNIGHDNRS